MTTPLMPPTRAKIVATAGPASESPEMVRKLIQAGVAVFRLNFSHGSLGDHARRLAVIRDVSAGMGGPVAVLGDLGGPKIRVGALPAEGLMLAQGAVVTFRPAPAVDADPGRTETVLPTTYEPLAREVEPGQRVLINDGAIRLLAVDRSGSGLRCSVLVGGLVTSGKGINLPDSAISAPAITQRDWECVEWAVKQDLDFLALSFVRTAREVLLLKSRLEGMCSVVRREGAELGLAARIPVIAKIEKPQAVADLDAIIDAADAVMVARGDLGVEMDLSQVPLIQKQVVARCAEWGKPCIVATQMLESMTQSATPTRAEASDVANAVLDGADALMLSGETAVGRHPDLVVATMRRIIAAAETSVAAQPSADSAPARLVASRYKTAALAHAAWYLARDLGARAIACWSQDGGGARYLSQNNFRLPVFAYSSSERATRRMALLASVLPIRADPPASGRLAHWTDMVERDLVRSGHVAPGDTVILLAGKPLGTAKSTNCLAVLRIGDPDGGFRSHIT